MRSSWWDTLKILRPIDYLKLSNDKSLFDVIYGLMRILLRSSCWMNPLDFYRMITLMLFLTLFLLFLFSVLWLDNQNLFPFQLDHRPPSRLVHWYPFWLVYHLHQLEIFRLLINLMQWTIIHPFLFYPNGLPRQLKLLDLMPVIFPSDKKLEVKRNMPLLHWWLMYLEFMILLHSWILKDDLNGNMICRHKLILCRRITLGT